MAEIDSWSETASSNTTVGGVNVAEHCLAANLNDGIRAVMAGVKEAHNDLLDGTVTVNKATNVTGVVPVANGGTGATSLSSITVGEATKATQDGSGNVITSTYLPLSGGTMTGTIVGYVATGYPSMSGATGSSLKLAGGPTWDRCAEVLLHDGTNSSLAGSFAIRAYSSDGSQCGDLWGWPNGTLTWQGKEIERVDSSGTTWIRYVSGIQICFFAGLYTIGQWISFPQAFISTPSIVLDNGDTHAGGWSSTGFNLDSVSTQATGQAYVCCVAIGWWK